MPKIHKHVICTYYMVGMLIDSLEHCFRLPRCGYFFPSRYFSRKRTIACWKKFRFDFLPKP